MSVQDGLLSFQIKETIFLSSDKANIGEVKELELVPDVEIIENKNEISITGCLQLHGRYEPVREPQVNEAGGSDSLLEAMKFTPFQLQDGEAKQNLYAQDAELVHRIPLNVSIPLSRISELNEIYAIVDSFDYEVKTPHQLQIQADLKISGIHLKNQQTAQSADAVTPAGGTEQESWEFVHVANHPQEGDQPTSIEEIERKLAELEREVEAREQQYQAYDEHTESSAPEVPLASSQYAAGPYMQSPYTPTPFTPTPYTQTPSPYTQAPYTPTSFNPSPYTPQQVQSQQQGHNQNPYPWSSNQIQPAHAEQQHEEPVPAVQETTSDQVEETDENVEVQAEYQEEASEESTVAAQAEPEHINVHYSEQDNLIDFQQAYEERQAEFSADQSADDWNEAATEEDIAEAAAEPENQPEEVEETLAQAEVKEKEMKVAIGSKPSAEKEAGLSITSLFTHAGRPKTEQAVQDKSRESSSTSSRDLDESFRGQAAELKGSLSSFVRENDQQFSRLKMCIIQREETLQSIADRYALPVSRLLEVNRLSTDRIAAGQVLYIPQ